VNGEAIYGARPTPFGAEFGKQLAEGQSREANVWRCTTKPGKLNIHLFQWARAKFELNGVTAPDPIASVLCLETVAGDR